MGCCSSVKQKGRLEDGLSPIKKTDINAFNQIKQNKSKPLMASANDKGNARGDNDGVNPDEESAWTQ